MLLALPLKSSPPFAFCLALHCILSPANSLTAARYARTCTWRVHVLGASSCAGVCRLRRVRGRAQAGREAREEELQRRGLPGAGGDAAPEPPHLNRRT
eukprot:6203936-Pleurochrysis_carterae.AAC.1